MGMHLNCVLDRSSLTFGLAPMQIATVWDKGWSQAEEGKAKNSAHKIWGRSALLQVQDVHPRSSTNEQVEICPE